MGAIAVKESSQFGKVANATTAMDETHPARLHGFLVNVPHIALCWELIYLTPGRRAFKCAGDHSAPIDFDMIAAVVAISAVGLGICCCCCLIFYRKSHAPGAESAQ